MPRAYFHDYRSRCYYHLTLSKLPSGAPFSCLVGNLSNFYLERSKLGQIIETRIHNFHQFSPLIQIHQYIIMPDHLHLLVYVSDRLEKALGVYIAMFKASIRKEWHQGAIFERDFYDRIIRPSHSLNDVYNYIRENPRRLLVRRERPDFFQRVRDIFIKDEIWEAYGNLQLLRNPFKDAVVVHRAESQAERKRNADSWFHLAANGGVLVSPFISQDEKEIRNKLEEMGGKHIRIVNEAFGKKFKPYGHEFELCEQGRLLLIAPKASLTMSRSICLKMNAVAEYISRTAAELILRGR